MAYPIHRMKWSGHENRGTVCDRHFMTTIFLLEIQRFSFLRGKSVLRWACWDQSFCSWFRGFLNLGSPLREVPL